MDIPRKNAQRNRRIRLTIILTIVGMVVLVLYVGLPIVGYAGLKNLKPAATSVDGSVVWRDTVKRGPITLDVRGLGTLVPEETMLIPATTQGRVAKILLRPGATV